MAEYRLLFGPLDGEIVNTTPGTNEIVLDGETYIFEAQADGEVVYVHERVFNSPKSRYAKPDRRFEKVSESDETVQARQIEILRGQIKELRAQNTGLYAKLREERKRRDDQIGLMNRGTTELLKAAKVIKYEREAKVAFRDGFQEAITTLNQIAEVVGYKPGPDAPWARLPEFIAGRTVRADDPVLALVGRMFAQPADQETPVGQQPPDYAVGPDKGSWPTASDYAIEPVNRWPELGSLRAWFRRLLGVNSPYNNG